MTNESAAIQAENLQREIAPLKKYRWLLLVFVMISVFLVLGVAPHYNPNGCVSFGLAGLLIPVCSALVGFMNRLTRLTLAQQREIEELKIRLAVLEDIQN